MTGDELVERLHAHYTDFVGRFEAQPIRLTLERTISFTDSAVSYGLRVQRERRTDSGRPGKPEPIVLLVNNPDETPAAMLRKFADMLDQTQGTLEPDRDPEEPAPGVGPIPYITLASSGPDEYATAIRTFATTTAPTAVLPTYPDSSEAHVVNTGTYLRKEDVLAYLEATADAYDAETTEHAVGGRAALRRVAENLRRMT